MGRQSNRPSLIVKATRTHAKFARMEEVYELACCTCNSIKQLPILATIRFATSAIMLFSLLFALSCLFTPILSAVVKRVDLTALASSAGLSYISFPLQRTPDGGTYLLNVSFTDSGDYIIPLQIDLNSPTSWVNTPSTYCANPGNLEDLTGGSCGQTAPESSCYGIPTPLTIYKNSDNTIMLGKHCSADLALGPVQIYAQDLIYADQNYIQPDDVSAGVLGLAYPEIFDSSPANILSPTASKQEASKTT